MALADIIGQDKALKILQGAMRRGRIATSYLFAGEQGIGKKLTAVNFAKALNCHNPVKSGEKGVYDSSDSCETCASCKKINAGSHPDFIMIGPSDTNIIKVEEIRRLEEMLSYKSFEGGYKTAIIDDAEAMNESAANAFLKTLEEPAQGSLIILVTSSPDMLPETIRSRCSRVNFSPLSDKDCEVVLKKKKDFSQTLVALSMGRPGLAVGDNLVKERDKFMDGLRLSSVKHPWKEKKDMERWLDLALIHLRDIAAMKVSGDSAIINKDKADDFAGLADRADIAGIMECYKKIQRLRGLTGFNLNKAITWSFAMESMREAGIIPGAQRE